MKTYALHPLDPALSGSSPTLLAPTDMFFGPATPLAYISFSLSIRPRTSLARLCHDLTLTIGLVAREESGGRS